MAQTFLFAAGHCDFKKGLKVGTQLHPWREHQKVTANERSLCSVTHGCSNCHSSSHKLLSLLKCLSAPHILSFLRGRGKLHTTRHLVFIGFLLLIGMLQKVGKFLVSFGLSVLCAKSKLQHIQHHYIFLFHTDAGHKCSISHLCWSLALVDNYSSLS